MTVLLVIALVASIGVAWWYKKETGPGFDDWDNPRDWHTHDSDH